MILHSFWCHYYCLFEDLKGILPHILSAQNCCCLTEDWKPFCLKYFLFWTVEHGGYILLKFQNLKAILFVKWRAWKPDKMGHSVVLLLSHGVWVFIDEICTHISTNPSYLISHCICLNTKTPWAWKLDLQFWIICLNTKTPNAQNLNMQTLDHLLQYQSSLNSEARHADSWLFASIPKPIKHKSYACRLPIVCVNTKTHYAQELDMQIPDHLLQYHTRMH
jgi:hypothetical protein